MLTLLPADNFVVINKTKLNINLEVLSKLYIPIMGGDSNSLYIFLYSLLDKNECESENYTHHFLVNALKNKLTNILECREKLEGLGLLKTYVKEDSINTYIYELYSPISAYEFLNNPILNVIFFNIVGKTEYERIVKYFKNNNKDLSGYKNISRKFSEVFDIVSYKSYEFSSLDIKKYKTGNLEIDYDIDFNMLISCFPSSYKNIFNKTNKNLILSLAFVYNLDTNALEKIIKASINNGILDSVLLRKSAKNYYSFENNGKLPNLIYKNQPESLKTILIDTSDMSKLIYMFENTSVYEFLSMKQHGASPTKRDLALVEELLVDYELTVGVVNVLIDYVLKVNNNKLTKSYVETIAGSWKRLNIKTVTEAINVAKKEHKKHNVIKNKGVKKEFNVPDWFDKNIEKNNVFETNKNELDTLLDEFK